MTGGELVAALDEELDRPSPRYREPLVLCYLEGLTRDEVAGRLGQPEATLKSQLERGRKKLADRVTLLSFSEFGRTIRENGSGGTDHGTAGGQLRVRADGERRAGRQRAQPDRVGKGRADDDTDFRRIYHALTADWLGLPPDAGAKGLDPLPLFQA